MLEKRVERMCLLGEMHHVITYSLCKSFLFCSYNSVLSVLVEGLKVVEIEKCKNDLKKLRDEMTSRGGAR